MIRPRCAHKYSGPPSLEEIRGSALTDLLVLQVIAAREAEVKAIRTWVSEGYARRQTRSNRDL
jgi:hypothetical protein